MLKNKNFYLLRIFLLIFLTINLFIFKSQKTNTNIRLLQIESNNNRSNITQSLSNSNSTKQKNNFEKFNEFLLEDIGNYMIDVQLGNPPQNFNLEVDTSISTLWVPSTNCINCRKENKENYKEYPLYDSNKSISALESNETILVEDYLGGLKGIQMQDKISINYKNQNKEKNPFFQMDNFTFIKAIELNKDYKDNPTGKIGFSNINQYGENFSLLENLYTQKKIPKKLFILNYNKSIKKGNIYFKQEDIINKEIQNNKKNWGKCNVTASEDLDDELRDSWICELTHINFDKKAKRFNLSEAFLQENSRVIFDSSYDFIAISYNNFDLIYENYIKKNFGEKCQKNIDSKAKEIFFICDLLPSDIQKAESFFFVIQGYVIEITINDLLIKSRLNENNYLLGIKFFREDNINENVNIWILGRLFIRNLLILFDAEEQEIKFYKEDLLDVTSDWEDWYFSDMYSLYLERNFYMGIGVGIFLTLLFLFTCFICCRRSMLRNKNEHGPLIENEQ